MLATTIAASTATDADEAAGTTNNKRKIEEKIKMN